MWPPFAFGAVHPWAFACAEIHIALLIIAWMLRLVIGGQPLLTSPTSAHWGRAWPILLPLLSFLILLGFQLLPMPPHLISYLSRSTYDIYQLFHPDWPHTSVILSLHPYATTLGLMKVLAYLGLFVFTVHHLRTPHHIRQAIWLMTLTAAATALLGICQHFAGFSAIYGWRDASYAHFFGTFLNRNHFAAYQSMAILIGLGLFVTGPIRGRHREVQWLLLFALAIMAGALCLTLSRGGVLSFLAGFLLFSALNYRDRKRRGMRLTGVIASLALMSLWLGLAPLIERFGQSFGGEAANAWGDRVAIYTATWDMFKAFPSFGIGLGAFPVVFPRYQPAEVTLRYLQAHSDILQLLVEMGAVGFLACAATVVGIILRLIHHWRHCHSELAFGVVPAGLAAIAAITLHAGVDFSLRIPANALLLTVILGITWRCANLPPEDVRDVD